MSVLSPNASRSLRLEGLEDRRMLTGLAVVSSVTDTQAFAMANANQASLSIFNATFAPATAADSGASAVQTTIARASAELPSFGVGGYVFGRASVDEGFAWAGELAEDPNWFDKPSWGTATSVYQAECDGVLHVLMTVQLGGTATADPLALEFVSMRATGYLEGSVSINEDAPIASLVAGGDVRLSEVLDTSSFEVGGHGPDGELSPISGVSSVMAVLSFSIVVDAGDYITFDGKSYLDQAASAEETPPSEPPNPQHTDATSSILGGLGIHASFECFPDPPPPESFPGAAWGGVGDPSTLPTEGAGESYGDFDGDGDMDDADLTAYLLLYRTETPLVVTTEDDELDNLVTNPAGYEFGDLSLREALALAADNSTYPGEDIIGFAPWIDKITLDGTNLGSLSIDSDVKIIGLGADRLTIDADEESRVMGVDSGVDATISGVTLTGGVATGGGGAIYNSGDLKLLSVDVVDNVIDNYGGGVYVADTGTLKVVDCTFDNNHATNVSVAGGGAIAGTFKEGMSLEIIDSTFSNNTAEAAGGGAILFFSNVGTSGSPKTITPRIENSTFSGNSANGGGAIQWQGLTYTTISAEITNSTFTKNIAEGWVGGGMVDANANSVITIHNSIIADNTAYNTTYHDVYGSLLGVGSASSHNLIGQVGNSGLTHNSNGNKVGTQSMRIDPLLAPLGDYGGRTKTHALKISSPALNAGDASLDPTHDQRGEERPLTGSDIGAFEAGDFTTLTVRSDGDRNDSVDLQATVDSLRLREALALSAVLAGKETIVFDEQLYADEPATILLTYDGSDSGSAPDTLTVPGYVTIAGPGADRLTINGNGQSVLYIDGNGGVNAIEGVTVTGGGTGVLANVVSELTIRGSRITGNNAGGVQTYDTALRIVNSEISDNVAPLGGGIAVSQDTNYYGLEIINSTISGNEATGTGSKGGGLYIEVQHSFGYDFEIINSAITNNTAELGGGIYSSEIDLDTDFLLLHNTIVADNTAGGDIAGEGLHSDSSHNLLRDGSSGGLSATDGNILLMGSNNARLSALSFHEGSTRTHVPLSDSPAIDAGDNAIALALDLDFDQRGLDRIVDWQDLDTDDEVDIGAVELAFDEVYSG